MRLLQASGTLHIDKSPEDYLPILVETADLFLRGGGVLCLTDWLELDDHERAAFVVAGNRIRSEMQATGGIAVHGSQYAADLMEIADDDEENSNLRLKEIVSKAVDKLGGPDRTNSLGTMKNGSRTGN